MYYMVHKSMTDNPLHSLIGSRIGVTCVLYMTYFAFLNGAPLGHLQGHWLSLFRFEGICNLNFGPRNGT